MHVVHDLKGVQYCLKQVSMQSWIKKTPNVLDKLVSSVGNFNNDTKTIIDLLFCNKFPMEKLLQAYRMKNEYKGDNKDKVNEILDYLRDKIKTLNQNKSNNLKM